MFDIKAIRENPAAFDRGLTRRGLKALSSEVLALDEKRRAHVTKLQELQTRRNAASKEIGKAKGQKDEAAAAKLMAEVAELKEALQAGEAEEKRLDGDIQRLLEALPNTPRDDVPEGKDEHGNKEMRRVGEPAKFAFKPKEHFDLGEALGLMDFETAAKISGARFVVLKGALARLERALGQFMLDFHTTERGYTECVVPLMVKDDAAYGTGNLPKFAEDLFQTNRSNSQALLLDDLASASGSKISGRGVLDAPGVQLGEDEKSKIFDERKRIELMTKEERLELFRPILDKLFAPNRLWLIPTAEVSLTNFVREEIVDEAKLPMRLTALTPCFRSEAGSAGRDTRGMIRQHQFSKVEMVSITTPEQSLDEHERMTRSAEMILEKLGLPYRTMLLCTGDMGFASQKTYDIEVWLPGQNSYREISSCSVCGDFQARRMNARCRAKDGKDIRFVHTLNGSGLAVGRTLIAILENYQEADGSITIPEPLVPYMGGLTRIAKS